LYTTEELEKMKFKKEVKNFRKTYYTKSLPDTVYAITQNLKLYTPQNVQFVDEKKQVKEGVAEKIFICLYDDQYKKVYNEVRKCNNKEEYLSKIKKQIDFFRKILRDVGRNSVNDGGLNYKVFELESNITMVESDTFKEYTKLKSNQK